MIGVIIWLAVIVLLIFYVVMSCHEEVAGGVTVWSFRKDVDRLLRMDKTDPEKRTVNEDDLWLKQKAYKIAHSSEALKVINSYGWLEKTFWEGLKDADKDIVFQRILIGVENEFCVVYSNMLFNYLKRWDFAPEIKELVFKDKTYARVVQTYKLLRDMSTGELLERHSASSMSKQAVDICQRHDLDD